MAENSDHFDFDTGSSFYHYVGDDPSLIGKKSLSIPIIRIFGVVTTSIDT